VSNVEYKEFTCVSCPVGCNLTVGVRDGQAESVEGNTCKRGLTYGIDEATNPKRVVTSLVDVADRVLPASVRTESAVPKAQIPDVVAALRTVKVTPPVHIGQVVVPDVCGTGVDVIATRDVE
jgi:CxxC motif-containing protein